LIDDVFHERWREIEGQGVEIVICIALTIFERRGDPPLLA
jgi:hypothetical protein